MIREFRIPFRPGSAAAILARVLPVLALLLIVGIVAATADSSSPSGAPPIRDAAGNSPQAGCSKPPSGVDACKYVLEHCQDFSEGLLDYMKIHYCSVPSSISGVSLVLQLCWLLILFLFLSTTAAEFFCPNLTTISNALNLSESVAGVTLLALGNGSPDLVSTFTAIKSHSGGLAMGELIGSATCISILIVGSVAIIAPFRISPMVFVRDCLFLIGALAIIALVTRDGGIAFGESFVLIAYYLVYVGAVLSYEYLETRRKRRSGPSVVAGGVAAGGDDAEDGEFVNEEAAPLLQRAPSHYSVCSSDDCDVVEEDHLHELVPRRTMPRMRQRLSLLDVVDMVETRGPWQLQQRRNYTMAGPPRLLRNHPHCNSWHGESAGNQVGGLLSPGLASAGPNMGGSTQQLPTPTPLGAHAETLVRTSSSSLYLAPVAVTVVPPSQVPVRSPPSTDLTLLTPRAAPPLLSPTPRSADATLLAPPGLIPPRRTESPMEDVGDDRSSISVGASAAGAISGAPVPSDTNSVSVNDRLLLDVPLQKHRSHLSLLFPVVSVRGSYVTERIVLCLISPLYFVLRISVPVVVKDTPPTTFGAEVRAPALCAAQYFFSTLFSTLLLCDWLDYDGSPWIVAFSVATGALVLGVTLSRNIPDFEKGVHFCWVGFFVSMLWIYMIANELVSVLKTVGLLMNIPDSILGLTVFAMGNSIADFTANVTMAKMGFPTMAISACFASPLLNLVLGIGFSCAFMGWRTGKVDLAVDRSILVSAIGLIVVLGVYLVVVPLQNFQIGRPFGFLLIGLYLALISTSLIIHGYN